MLDLVNCKVLSILEAEHVDAYLLSESSMFIWPHKLVLKTCGTTTLLCGLPHMLEIAALEAGFPHVEADLPRGIPTAATPYRVFYSRKNFLYPNKQHGPHRSWRDEVRFLDKLFLGGSAYMIGKMNGDHWYLYITGPDTQLTPPSSPDSEYPATQTRHLSVPIEKYGDEEQEDETLEILMTDLDEKNARQFYLEDASAVAEGRYFQKFREARKNAMAALGEVNGTKPVYNGLNAYDVNTRSDDADFDVFEQTSSDHSGFSSDDDTDVTLPDELSSEGHALGTVVAETCGLADVYPTSKYRDAKIDSYLFTPCGFSANGVVPAAEGDTATSKAAHYFTVHVTPEPQCSYASFETNVPTRQSGRQTADLVEQVVRIFRPGRFSVTFFEAKPADLLPAAPAAEHAALANARARSARMEALKGYRRVDRIVHDLDGYELVFRYYEREDWKGGKPPRLGENGV